MQPAVLILWARADERLEHHPVHTAIPVDAAFGQDDKVVAWNGSTVFEHSAAYT
jgi:hypothetical protein